MPTTETFQFKAMPGQVSIDEAKGVVECFVAGIGNKDSVGDIVLPGAFTESLKRRKPRVVWGHDWNHPIGKVLEIYEVPASDPRLPAKMKRAGIGGLFARVQFNLKADKGREAFANVAFYGEEQEWSIGYKTLDAIYDNQRQANLLREVELYEVSPVLHGANQLTGTISIKAAEPDKVVDSFKKSKWPMFDREFAERIKRDYPQIWAAGGNIKGNDQYRILTQIAEEGGVAKSQAQTNALELREAWVARHAGDFRLPGVIAQIKWLAIGSRGEDYMKNVVREAIDKHEAKMKKKGYPMPMPDLNEEMDEEKGHGGMMRSLSQAISSRFGGPVVIRHADSNMVIFTHMMEGKPHTMRVAYHFDGEQFMFGKPVGVKPTVIYMPEEEEYGEEEYEDSAKQGCSCGSKSGQYNQLARDNDGDGIVQEGTDFARRANSQPQRQPVSAGTISPSSASRTLDGKPVPPPTVRGNIDLSKRKPVKLSDGSIATIRSMSFNEGGMEVVVPTIGPNGEDWSDDQAYQHYKQTGQHLGKLKTPQEAETYAIWLHEQEEQRISRSQKPTGVVRTNAKTLGEGELFLKLGELVDSFEANAAEVEAKAGRVLSTNNIMKLQQAMDLLREVLAAGGRQDVEMKEKSANVSANLSDLFEVKQMLDPIFEYHGLEATANEFGIDVKGIISDDALTAIKTAISNFEFDAELITEEDSSAEV